MIRRRALLALASTFALSLGFAFVGCGHDTTTATSTTGGGQPYCGDRLVQPDLGEECDTGAKDNSGACLASCKKARCGDGFLWSGVEECDDGNSDVTDGCPLACLVARCGDGFIQKGAEQCDDGNEENGDACSSVCHPGVGCGNAVLDVGEECDDGNRSNFDACTVDCKKAHCGDGYGQAGVEECDDGNTVDNDACSNACKVNPIATPGCPGTAIPITMGTHLTLGAKGTEGVTAEQGSCGGAGHEVVYAITPDSNGLLKLTMFPLADTLDAVLYVRTSCGDATSEIDCENRSGGGSPESMEVPVTGGKTYYVFADSRTPMDTGAFYLFADLSTDIQGDDCPGVPVPLALNQTASFTGNTMSARADRIGTELCASPNTKDIVYEIAPQSDGQVFAQVMPMYDASFYVRTSCGDSTSQLQCSETGGTGVTETLNIPVVASHRYYFVVDGHNGDAGPYTVTFTLGKH